MDKTVEINEVVTFIKATREEAVALAYDIGGGEVHALHIQRGFGMPSENPVGYLVMPLKREWAGLTDDEREHFRKLGFVGVLAVENRLKEKNT